MRLLLACGNESLVNVAIERIFVGVGNRNVLLAEHDAIAFDDLGFSSLNDERTMNSNESILRQFSFQVFKTHKRHDASVERVSFGIYDVELSFEVNDTNTATTLIFVTLREIAVFYAT